MTREEVWNIWRYHPAAVGRMVGFRDLTDDMKGITDKWKEENLTFDCVYTGYLGSKKQIGIVSDIFDGFKTEDNFIIVDPAMADNGKLYAGFTPDFVAAMAELCGKADYILPNLTEAAFMLNIPYVESGYDEDYIKDVLKKLTGLGAKTAILTGVSFDGKTVGDVVFDEVAAQAGAVTPVPGGVGAVTTMMVLENVVCGIARTETIL